MLADDKIAGAVKKQFANVNILVYHCRRIVGRV